MTLALNINRDYLRLNKCNKPTVPVNLPLPKMIVKDVKTSNININLAIRKESNFDNKNTVLATDKNGS